jgi:hypothetical protein
MKTHTPKMAEIWGIRTHFQAKFQHFTLHCKKTIQIRPTENLSKNQNKKNDILSCKLEIFYHQNKYMYVTF